MKLNCALVVAFITTMATFAYAQKTYTPAELRKMVDAGMFPRQGSPTTKAESMNYTTCIAKVESVIASVRPNYPTRTVASTNIMRMEKLWTNDAAMTLTCSAHDGKFVITSAPYL